MGHRLSRIYTSTGDDGTTGPGDGARAAKGDPRIQVIGAGDGTRLEEILAELNAERAPLKEFILPGGSRAAALCHVARAVCRRAERRVYTLSRSEPVSPVTL